jgi:hypothetical protein
MPDMNLRHKYESQISNNFTQGEKDGNQTHQQGLQER